jgi:hypothetical protein
LSDVKTASIAAAVIFVLAARAEAGPLADAIARHAEADVSALRAQLPGDSLIRCTLGAVYGKRNDLSRAMIYLADCEDAKLPEDIAMDIVRATRDVKKRARDSELAALNIVTNPSGMTVELDALAGEKLVAPVTVWIKAGTHTVRATGDGKAIQNTVTLQAYSRTPIFLDAGTRAAPPAKDGKVDFSEDNAGEQTSGPPPDIKRPSMMKGKYRGVTDGGGPVLEDPLAMRVAASPRPWFGIRVGGGIFDDGAATSTFRPSVAATGRFELAPRLFLAARLDWSRRGGAGDTAIDSVGASAGVGVTIATPARVAIALIGQLRGDLRFSDARDMTPVRRAGASAAAGIEAAFPSTPVTAGVRFEQGLSELVAGAHDRAVMLELGVDWR